MGDEDNIYGFTFIVKQTIVLMIILVLLKFLKFQLSSPKTWESRIFFYSFKK